MDQAEASGKTVEDALNRALAQLGAKREDVEFTVLDEGKKGGLFGRGAKDATVRVERMDSPSGGAASTRDAADTRIPRGNGRGQSAGQRGGRDRNDRPQRDDRGPRPERAAGAERGARGPRPQGRAGLDAASPKLSAEDFMRRPDGSAPAPAAERAPAPERAPRPDRGPRPERAPRTERPERAPRAERPPREDDEERRSRRRQRDELPPVAADINAEEVDFAAHITDDLLRLLDITCDISIREPLTPGEGLGSALAVIDISGEDLGLLIGRRGDTLLSLQYLVNLIVGRRFPEKGNVTIDVEHYRHRREEQVLAVAHRMADRIREQGGSITMEPMPPAERRLIHLAFADDADLETNSIGDGDNRKVVISARR